MPFTMHIRAIFIISVIFLIACTCARADTEPQGTLSLGVSTFHSSSLVTLNSTKSLPQHNHPKQDSFKASSADNPYSFAEHQDMQAASEAVSAERPIGNIVIAVMVSGVLFGLGMGM